ncbi:MAG: glycosyl transferase, partial [Verrucomicrobiota bacterium]
ARTRPITLLLPCHGSDLDRPALAHIVEQLRDAAFLREIIVSMNGADAAGLARARSLFAPLPQVVRFFRNDGPSTGALLAGFPQGKGLNVWSALGVICREARSKIVVLQDCDVASFRRGVLARLCYACAHPQLDYAFAKMYYSRATDRLYGRVSRLFFAPLLHAIVRMVGHHPLIDFLLSFRYPLAGECAFRCEVAECLPLESGWGLETGMLCEAFRHIDPRQVCQVAGGGAYDHKHQSATGGLAVMSGEIARTLFIHLAREGLDSAFHSSVTDAYRREALVAVRRSANLALINGLPFDEPGERAIVELFAAQLSAPGSSGVTLPAWSAVARTDPGFAARLTASYQAD